MKGISMNNIMSVINSGKIFTACFTKKDGSERVINCRTGVSKYVKGTGTLKTKKHLRKVYDLKKKGYRTINLNTLKWIKAEGNSIVFKKGRKDSIFKNELIGTSNFSNISGCKIFAKISIPVTTLILGLLKNEFASTAKTFLSLTAFN